jgi:hypothetical protein
MRTIKKFLNDYGLLALSLLALVGVSALSINSMKQMDSLGNEIYEKGFQTYKETSNISLILKKQHGIIAGSLSEYDMTKVEKSQQEFAEISKEMIAKLEQDHPQLTKAYTGYMEEVDRYFGLVKLFAQDQAAEILNGSILTAEKSFENYFKTAQENAGQLAISNVANMDEKAASIAQQLTILATLLFAVIGAVGFIMGRIQAKKNRQISVMNSCLASMQTNVIIIDENNTISYINNACKSHFSALLEKIQHAHPLFKPEEVEGYPLTALENKYVTELLPIAQELAPSEKHSCQIEIGELIIDLNISGIYDGSNRLGTYIDWEDVTSKVLFQRQRDELEKEISQIATGVSTAASEIASGNLSLSERTEAQAANVEETTATMQNITEQVNEAANSAGQATELALSMREFATGGQGIVDETNSAMKAIAESSERINTIIGVIDEIAFQTNLLALNAAVEAARAGEAGRGFAVVATEVRTLAGRSANAAQEIKELIGDAVNKVHHGSHQVHEMNEYLNRIVGDIQNISTMVKDISDAAKDQAVNIAEINRAVNEVDSFTQQNSALVEEATSASRSLEEQASALTDAMTRFSNQ